MRDHSRPIWPPLGADFGARMDAARRSQEHYDRHVAPIVSWALAEYGSRRAAYDALVRLQHDDDTSDTAYALIGAAIVTLRG